MATTSEGSSAVRVLMAAGGTGGHVYPAIAIADALKEQLGSVSILFAGTRDRMEWEAVPRAGYRISPVWISGFHRYWTVKNLLFPLKVVVSLVQSLLMMIRFRPHVVIACGGFVSGPVGWMAARFGKPLMIQEQNSYPGVTNRMLAKHARIIFTAFEEAARYFPAEAASRVRLTGNPIRQSLQLKSRAEGLMSYGLSASRPCILVLGGSGGAREINEILLRTLPQLRSGNGVDDRVDDRVGNGAQVIWQCGPAYVEPVLARLKEEGMMTEGAVTEGLHVAGYLRSIEDAYSAADLVVSRAGASTCSELMALGKPSLLIPSPNVAGDHQTKNAEAMTSEGAAVMLLEKDLERDFVRVVGELLGDPSRLAALSAAAMSLAKPHASSEIAQICLAEIGMSVGMDSRSGGEDAQAEGGKAEDAKAKDVEAKDAEANGSRANHAHNRNESKKSPR